MPRTTSRETAASPQDRYQRRLGAGLTPQAITAAQREADLGQMARWADLLDEVRQGDPHLHGDLTKREVAVSGAEYELRLPKGASKREGARSLQLCEAALEAIEVPCGSLAVPFRGALQQLASATYHGRAAVEVVWARDGRYLLPRHLYPVHARRLAWSNERDWRLHLYDATSGDTPFARFPGVPCDDAAIFPRGKLLVHTPRGFGTYPTREGLGRALVWYSAFKRWTVRDWLAFAEWAGRGLRVGKYATGRDPSKDARANEEDKDALEAALDAMSSTVTTVIPDTTDLDIKTVTDNDVHPELVKLCNGEMSKVILGGTLTSDPGEKGARSLGEVHLRAMFQLLRGDAASIADVIRRDLLTAIVRANLGDRAPVPHLALNVDPPEDAKARAERLVLYMREGLTVPSKWIRDLESIPDPKDGEEVVGGKPAPKPDPAAPPGTKPKPGDPPPADDTDAAA